MSWKELSHQYRTYMQIAVDEQRHLVRLVRTVTPLPKDGPLGIVTQFFREMDRVLLPPMRARYRLLVDSRLAPRMIDPTTASDLSGLTREFYGDFQRVAFLLRTPIGLMQMRRIIKTLDFAGEVFDDEAEAMSFLLRSEPPAGGATGRS